MSLLAAFKALSWFTKLGGLTAIPFVGPILATIGGIAQLVCMAITAFFKGLAEIVTKPLPAFTLVCCCIAFGILGLRYGVKYDAHLVEAANTRVANLESQLEDKDAVDKANAEEAIRAREAAKRASPSVVKGASVAPAAAPGGTAPKRVRRKPAGDEAGCCDEFKRMFGL